MDTELFSGCPVSIFSEHIIINTDNNSSAAGIIVDVPVALGPQFFAWVFGMENYITIVGPNEVIGQMKDMLQKVSRRYR